jgi:Ribosomal RNA-processing protein 7 (RRP7) C-terminal domain
MESHKTKRVKSSKFGEFLAVRLETEKSFKQWLFFKQGESDDELVVANIDPSCTLQDIQEAFEKFGVVCAEIKNNQAVILLESSECLKEALQCKKISLNQSNPLQGYDKWTSECQKRKGDPEIVQLMVTHFMEEFDGKQAQEKLEMENEVVDDDGFTLVSKKRGRKGASDGDIHVKTTTRVKRAKDSKEEDGFYTFKAHEKKQNELMEVRKKFQADKERLKKERSKRKFIK